jgi:hypothetical protein
MRLVQGNKEQSTWKEHWLDQIDVEKLGIPVITGIPKDEGNDKLSFSTFTRFRGMIEIIRDSNKKFKTMQDVVRAAFYIGINILYRMHERDVINKEYGEALYQHIARNEQLYRRNQVLDDVVLEVKRLTDLYDKGYITKDICDEQLAELENNIPDDAKEAGVKAVRSVMAAKYDKSHAFRISEHLSQHTRKDLMK